MEAKAIGGFCEARGWSGDSEIQKRYTKVWNVDDLVSGKKEDCLVSISSITGDNKWFNLDGVMENPSTSLRTVGGHEVTTLTVDRSGINIDTRIHH